MKQIKRTFTVQGKWWKTKDCLGFINKGFMSSFNQARTLPVPFLFYPSLPPINHLPTYQLPIHPCIHLFIHQPSYPFSYLFIHPFFYSSISIHSSILSSLSFILFCLLYWATPDCDQGLHLALSSGINPGGTRGLLWYQVCWLRVPTQGSIFLASFILLSLSSSISIHLSFYFSHHPLSVHPSFLSPISHLLSFPPYIYHPIASTYFYPILPSTYCPPISHPCIYPSNYLCSHTTTGCMPLGIVFFLSYSIDNCFPSIKKDDCQCLKHNK